MAFYSGQLEPVVPSPFERAPAYFVDFLLSVFVLAAVIILIAGETVEGIAAFLAGHALYHIGPTIALGGTPAKLLSGLRVRMADGSRISPDAAILRYLVYSLTVFYVPFGALITGYFIMTSPERLSVHDRVARTIVMYREKR